MQFELKRHLWRRTGDCSRAEEVMQETYLRLLETDSRQQQGNDEPGGPASVHGRAPAFLAAALSAIRMPM